MLKFFGHKDPDVNFIFLSRMERTQMETFLCDLLRRWVAAREAGRYSPLCEMSALTLRYDYIIGETSLGFTRRAVNILKPVFVFRADKLYDHRRDYKTQEATMLKLILLHLSKEHVAYSAVLEFLQEFGSIILDACTSSSVAVTSTCGYYSVLHELELADIADIVQSAVNWWLAHEKRFPLEPLIPVVHWVLQMLAKPNMFHVIDWEDIPSKLVTLPLRFGVSAGAILHLLSANPRPCSNENRALGMNTMSELMQIDATETSRWSNLRHLWVSAVFRASEARASFRASGVHALFAMDRPTKRGRGRHPK
jgi:hypothetical protein